jgi:hypothetical protein
MTLAEEIQMRNIRVQRDDIRRQLLDTQHQLREANNALTTERSKQSCCCDIGKAFKKITDVLDVANADYAEIAELAVEKIKDGLFREDPEVGWMGACLQAREERNALKAECEALKQELDQMEYKQQPEPPKKAVYEWVEGDDKFMLFRDSHLIGHVHLCGHYYGNARNGMGDIIKSPSLSLAKAAVEAVVRAHYGDEA